MSVLKHFRKYVVSQARRNLTINKKKKFKTGSDTRELWKSIKGREVTTPGSILQTFFMKKYGEFQDKGVKGTKSNYVENSKSPFSFNKSKKAIDSRNGLAKWVKRKNLRFRDEKTGRFKKTNFKSLTFLIARSIHEKGIKRSLFFTKPFEKRYKMLPNKIATAMANDIVKDIMKQKKL